MSPAADAISQRAHASRDRRTARRTRLRALALDLESDEGLFRWLLAVPHLIILYVLGIVMMLLTVVAWFVILITGRHPQGIHSTISQILRWNTRVNGYMYLLTDEYPPFNGDE